MSWLAFADQKVAQVGDPRPRPRRGARRDRGRPRRGIRCAGRPRRGTRRARARGAPPRSTPSPTATSRAPRTSERVAAQESLDLPELPTTTIGSFPQTGRDPPRPRPAPEGRALGCRVPRPRCATRSSASSACRRSSASTCSCTASPSATTWCSTSPSCSTASRSRSTAGCSRTARAARARRSCGATSRGPAPMTVEWSTFAQSLTEKPVKGMLTGPVTILAWSFVRDDQPLGDTARQVALALRDEIGDLESAGIRRHPGRRAGAARAAAAEARRPAGVPRLVGAARSGSPRAARPPRPRCTPTSATRSSAW